MCTWPTVVIDGLIDSPGTRALPVAQQRPEVVMNPVKIAEAFFYLPHTRNKSCWTTRAATDSIPDQSELLRRLRQAFGKGSALGLLEGEEGPSKGLAYGQRADILVSVGGDVGTLGQRVQISKMAREPRGLANC